MNALFETERLNIRKFESSDAERLFAIHRDEQVKKWFPNETYADLEETRQAIAFFAGRAEERKLPFVLAAALKETGELIGDAGISEVEGKPGEAEVGYVIGLEHRNKGYAAELLAAMTDYAAAVFPVRTFYGRVIKGNGASVRVLEKNGYRFAAEESGAEDDPYGNGMLVYVKNR